MRDEGRSSSGARSLDRCLELRSLGSVELCYLGSRLGLHCLGSVDLLVFWARALVCGRPTMHSMARACGRLPGSAFSGLLQ